MNGINFIFWDVLGEMLFVFNFDPYFCSISDSLIDCEDPDCCLSASICIGDALCEAPPDPIEVIRSSNQFSAFTPSILFYDRVKFLIEPNSIHRSPPQILFSNDR